MNRRGFFIFLWGLVTAGTVAAAGRGAQPSATVKLTPPGDMDSWYKRTTYVYDCQGRIVKEFTYSPVPRIVTSTYTFPRDRSD